MGPEIDKSEWPRGRYLEDLWVNDLLRLEREGRVDLVSVTEVFENIIKVARPILWLAVNNPEPIEKSEPAERNFSIIADASDTPEK